MDAECLSLSQLLVTHHERLRCSQLNQAIERCLCALAAYNVRTRDDNLYKVAEQMQSSQVQHPVVDAFVRSSHNDFALHQDGTGP